MRINLLIELKRFLNFCKMLKYRLQHLPTMKRRHHWESAKGHYTAAVAILIAVVLFAIGYLVESFG